MKILKYFVFIILIFTIISSGCIKDPITPYDSPFKVNFLVYSEDHKLLQNEVINQTAKFPNGYTYIIPIETNSTYRIYVSTNERGQSVIGYYAYYVNQSTTDRFGTQYKMVLCSEGWEKSNDDNIISNFVFTIPSNAYSSPEYKYKPTIEFRTSSINQNYANINITLIKI
jgi:hypothetical protein